MNRTRSGPTSTSAVLLNLLLYPAFGICWTYDLPTAVMDRGIRGASGDSFVKFLTKLHQGQKVQVAMLGGSFSMKSPHLWFDQVLQGLREEFPSAGISGHNAAHGGTNPAFALLCLDNQIPIAAVDLVMLEFNNNNGPVHASMEDPRVQSFERLLRRLRSMDGDPAVVIHNFHAPDRVYKEHGYHATPEDSVSILAEYYGLVSLSMRAVLFHLQRQGHAGFSDAEVRRDGLHFNERGHKFAADFFMRAVHVARSYMIPVTTAAAAQPAPALPVSASNWLPDPMLPNNHPRQTTACAIKHILPSLVIQNSGRDFRAEDKRREKFGLIANQPGDSLVMSINS